MRKIFLTLTLSLALAASVTAGELPITGFAGCAPGLWYPDSQVCVYPLSPQTDPLEARSTILDTMLIEAFFYLQPMF